jgi:hypothetical protein
MRLRGAGSAMMIVAAMVVAATIIAGCTSAMAPGDPPAPSLPSAATPGPPGTAVPATVVPSVAPDPGVAGRSAPAGSPPRAMLEGLPRGAAVPGDLGSYTWDGFASDGPWVVTPTRHAATAGAGVRVSFDAGPRPVSWTATWAAVRGGRPGTPLAAGSGSDGITIVVPARPGDWSLRVTASFGEGRQAAWFWHLSVVP